MLTTDHTTDLYRRKKNEYGEMIFGTFRFIKYLMNFVFKIVRVMSISDHISD